MGKKLKPMKSIEMASLIVAYAGEALLGPDQSVDAESLSSLGREISTDIENDRKAVAAYYRSNIAILLNLIGAEKGECRGCKREIWWVVSKNGKRSPITVDGLNHFSDCPDAKRFR